VSIIFSRVHVITLATSLVGVCILHQSFTSLSRSPLFLFSKQVPAPPSLTSPPLVLPCRSSIDLPRISADIYTVELATKLRAFLSLCPPPAPSPPVVDLLHAVADFERDLQERGIHCAPGVGVSAIGQFGDYIEVATAASAASRPVLGEEALRGPSSDPACVEWAVQCRGI
jgi:hypothetical protein